MKKVEKKKIKDVKIVLKICDNFNLGEDLSMIEIKILAYTDLTNANYSVWNYALNTFEEIMKVYGAKEWNNKDEDFPNNPYCTGYVLNGEEFITGYTGVVGHFWRQDGSYTIAKP